MPHDQDSAAEAALAAELRLAVMRLRRRMVGERHPDNELSIGAMAVLGCLHARGEQTAAELARHERVQPPTMTRMVHWLAERGHVARRPHETDGRQVLVSLTDKGRQTVFADRDRRDAWLARRLVDLDPDEVDAIRAAVPVLTRLAQGD